MRQLAWLFNFSLYICTRSLKARVAQLVEHDLAKVGVAGSNPVSRSLFSIFPQNLFSSYIQLFLVARVVELVDTQDLKSCGLWAVRVQVPLRAQKKWNLSKLGSIFFFRKRGCFLLRYSGKFVHALLQITFAFNANKQVLTVFHF